MSAPSSRADEKSAASLAAELFGILAFYLYFAGWVYASDIFGLFGVSLGNTDIPAYFFIVYSFSVFFKSVCGCLLLAAVGAAWYALARYRFIRPAEVVLLLVVAVLPFPLIRTIAGSRATSDAAYLRDGRAKHVSFEARTALVAAAYDKTVLGTLKSGRLRLLLQTKERYFVFLQEPKDHGILPAAQMYDVPTADFLATVTLSDLVEAKP